MTAGSGSSLSQRHLRTPGLEAHEVRLVDEDLGRLLDQDDAVVRRNHRRQRVEERRLACARPAGDEDGAPLAHGLREVIGDVLP